MARLKELEVTHGELEETLVTLRESSQTLAAANAKMQVTENPLALAVTPPFVGTANLQSWRGNSGCNYPLWLYHLYFCPYQFWLYHHVL